jgi:hypothetical protein
MDTLTVPAAVYRDLFQLAKLETDAARDYAQDSLDPEAIAIAEASTITLVSAMQYIPE